MDRARAAAATTLAEHSSADADSAALGDLADDRASAIPEARRPPRRPFGSVLREGRRGRGTSRIVVVPELEAAVRAHLVGRPAQKVLLRRRDGALLGRRPGLVGLGRQLLWAAHRALIHRWILASEASAHLPRTVHGVETGDPAGERAHGAATRKLSAWPTFPLVTMSVGRSKSM
jgi:hypothetical protein